MRRLWRGHRRGGYRKWNENCEGGSTISLFSATRDRDFSPSCFHQLFGHPKTDARSEITLCGEKRFEDLRQMLLPNSVAIIPNNCLNPVSHGTDNRPNRDAEHPSLAHCICRIRNDIGEDLENLAFADQHLPIVKELLVGSNSSSKQFRTVYRNNVLH